MKLKTYLLAAGLLSSTFHSFGNGLEISNVSPNADYTQLSFDISWENSWRQTERFHDAAWVFVKYLPDNASRYIHGHITGGIAGNGLEIITQPDSMGIFIRNAADFTGDVPATTVTVDLALDADIAIHPDFKVYGLEMVYVPEGPFYVGDGNPTSLKSYLTIYQGGEYEKINGTPYVTEVSSGTISTKWYLPENSNANSPDIVLPVTFPNGYGEFYCMKYPFTQEQYVEYLNQLDKQTMDNLIQISEHEKVSTIDPNFIFNRTNLRQGIWISYNSFNPLGGYEAFHDLNSDGEKNNPDDGQSIAVNFQLDGDLIGNQNSEASNFPVFISLLNLLNWSGLRPMSELEYEKACRGPLHPIPGEYAWGSPGGDIETISGKLIDPGTDTERFDSAYLIQNPKTRFVDNFKPYRVGMFADGATDRLSAQASYWGIQDLSGNGFPVLISIENEEFTGKVGGGSPFSYPKEWGQIEFEDSPPYDVIANDFIMRKTVSGRIPEADEDGYQGIFKIDPSRQTNKLWYNFDGTTFGFGAIQGRGVRQP